jgi:hypothetical protein
MNNSLNSLLPYKSIQDALEMKEEPKELFRDIEEEDKFSTDKGETFLEYKTKGIIKKE